MFHTTVAGAILVIGLHALQNEVAVFLCFSNGISMAKNINALIAPIAIPQYRMPLTVLIDDQDHRLIRHRLDLGM